MRTLWTRWVLPLACVALFACGDGSGGDGGKGGGGKGGDPAGGSGGSGGAGGNGGEGNPGGSGGDDSPCGNGELDPGEECDDGNRKDNDGCSSDCKLEGTCERPINFRPISEFSPPHGQRIAMATFDWALSSEVNSCGNGQRSVVFVYKNGDQAGTLLVGGGPAGLPAMTVAAREECKNHETELSCIGMEAQAPEAKFLEPGEEVYFIADGPEAFFGEDQEFWVGTIFRPVLGEGDECDIEPQPGKPRCRPGLACGTSSGKDICQKDEAPVLSELLAYRNGDELIVLPSGQDVPGNVLALAIDFLDAGGEALPYTGYIQGIEGLENLVEPSPSVLGRKNFRADWVDSEFFQIAGVAGTTSVRVSLLDTNANFSNELVVEVEPIPVMQEEDRCDPNHKLNVCDEGLECRLGSCRPAN